jgi:hypothetical protein
MPSGSRSPSTSRARPRRALRPLVAAMAVALAAACAGDDGPTAPPASIVVQPQDQAVFEGQPAMFQVWASGTDGLTYQWRRNGIPIAGAIDSHVATQATVPGDDGTTYSVAVTNAGGAPVESRAARLTVNPPLDLRFQWVGAPYAPSYVTGSDLIVGLRSTWGGTGSPLAVGMGSFWWYHVDPTVPGMTIAYEASALAALPPDWASALPPDTVVTSLDLEVGSGAYAMALSQTTQAGEFTPVVQGSVALDQLQAVAASEGASGRVLTAVSFQGGLVTYVSYGWSRARSATYEAKVVGVKLDMVVPEALGLAAEGYAITAFGAGDDAANGLVLVGTRPQGETTPRALQVVTPGPGRLPIDGYAIVGYFFDPAASALRVIAEQ